MTGSAIKDAPIGRSGVAPTSSADFQGRVQAWVLAIPPTAGRGRKVAAGQQLVADALSAGLACGLTSVELRRAVDRALRWSPDSPRVAIGRLMLSLAILALDRDVSMHKAADDELARAFAALADGPRFYPPRSSRSMAEAGCA